MTFDPLDVGVLGDAPDPRPFVTVDGIVGPVKMYAFTTSLQLPHVSAILEHSSI